MSKELFLNEDLKAIAMDKTEFFLRAKEKDEDGTCSGFYHFGQHKNNEISREGRPVNDGLWAKSKNSDILYIGYDSESREGTSEEKYSVFRLEGIDIRLSTYSDNNNASLQILIQGSAPNGLDSLSGGTYTDINEAIAFGGKTLSASVLSRQDTAFLEIWFEDITDSGIIAPYGNVQFLDNVHYRDRRVTGISLTQPKSSGYSSWGKWDVSGLGYMAEMSKLSAEEIKYFLTDPQNNIYYDDGRLIQVKYRIRTEKALGNDWSCVTTEHDSVRYLSYTEGVMDFIAQGSSDTSPGLSDGNSKFSTSYGADAAGNEHSIGVAKCFVANDLAHEGRCYAVPICTVQRRNTGAYHPVYNNEGVGMFLHRDLVERTNNPTTGYLWTSSGNSYIPEYISDTFKYKSPGHGSLASGTSAAPFYDTYYDGITTDDVLDLRFSCREISNTKAYDMYHQKALSGLVRGFDKLPYSDIFLSASETFVNIQGNNIYIEFPANSFNHSTPNGRFNNEEVFGNIMDSNDVVYDVVHFESKSNYCRVYLHRRHGLDISIIDRNGLYVGVGFHYRTSRSANPIYCNIAGSPTYFKTAIPDGIIGRWIPMGVSVGVRQYEFSRKQTDFHGNYRTPDMKAVSLFTGSGASGAANYWSGPLQATDINLFFYRTPAHFAEPSVNSPVLKHGEFTSSCSGDDTSPGLLLQSSLLGIINRDSNSKRVARESMVEIGMDYSTGKLASDGLNGFCRHKDTDLHVTVDDQGFKCYSYMTSHKEELRLNFCYKQMQYNYALDNSSEMIYITYTDASQKNVGELFKMVTGNHRGFWRCLIVTSLVIDFPTFYRLGDKLVDSMGLAYFEGWEGNGFGDDSLFHPIDNNGSYNNEFGIKLEHGTGGFNLPYRLPRR